MGSKRPFSRQRWLSTFTHPHCCTSRNRALVSGWENTFFFFFVNAASPREYLQRSKWKSRHLKRRGISLWDVSHAQFLTRTTLNAEWIIVRLKSLRYFLVRFSDLHFFLYKRPKGTTHCWQNLVFNLTKGYFRCYIIFLSSQSDI